jgi:hypothetical protein
MSDADELARRYFALWADYLTALVADPQAGDLLQRWIAFTGQFAKTAGEHGAAFAWPPIPPARSAAESSSRSSAGSSGRSTAHATASASSSGERDDAVGELARRVAELERRVAVLEPQPGAARARKRDRPGRA